MSQTLDIKNLSIGMKADASHLITDTDVRAFAEVSKDYNPIHLDDDYAKSTSFGRRIAHGAMVASYFSSLFTTKLPGPGCIYVAQETKFKKPVFIEDTVLVEIEVVDINIERKRVFFATRCLVNDVEVLSGKAEIYIP